MQSEISHIHRAKLQSKVFSVGSSIEELERDGWKQQKKKQWLWETGVEVAVAMVLSSLPLNGE